MEYCITILAESLDVSKFRQPTAYETAWGVAVRAEEEGKLFWENGIWIVSSPIQDFLINTLPARFQELNWICLCIGKGKSGYITEFNEDPQSLASLINTLLSNQARWAAFFCRDCDRIENTYEVAAHDLLDIVAQAFDYRSEPAKGFCAYPPTTTGTAQRSR